MITENTNYINEIIELAEAEGIYIPDEYKAVGIASGVKISNASGSIYGEKTVSSIESKVSRKVLFNHPNFRMIDLNDPIRAKLVVEKYQHVPKVMELIRRENPNTKAELQYYQNRNYRGNHVNTIIEGLCSELQIVSPVQGLFDHITSGLYVKTRENKGDPNELQRLEKLAKHIYDTLWGNIDFWNTDIEIRSKSLDFGAKAFNDLNQLSKDDDVLAVCDKEKENVIKVLSLSPKLDTYSDGKIKLDKTLVERQAKLMNQIAVKKQPKLVKFAHDIFDEYKHLLERGKLPSDLNKKQHYIRMKYDMATDRRILELDAQGISDPAQHMRDHYGEEMNMIEKNHVLPAIEQMTL